MSYDVDFYEVYRGGRVNIDSRNYTSNVSPMWSKALGENLGDLIERVAHANEIANSISEGVEAMQARPEEFRAMNPENGWGRYEGALEYLQWIAETCAKHPTARLEVSR